MHRNKRTIFSCFAVILWMIIIFVFSAQESTETNHLSMSVSQMMIGNKAIGSTEISDSSETLEWFNTIIRECAHFFLYFVLGILAVNAVRRTGMRSIKGFYLSASICFAYAISDEVHQIYVPGRYSSIKDILIDILGAIMGIGIYWIIHKKTLKNYPD